MAATTVVNTSLKFNEAQTLPAAVAVDATDGALVDYSNKEDARILLILENGTTSENTVTVKAGDSIQGISDLTVTLASSEKKGDNGGKRKVYARFRAESRLYSYYGRQCQC